MIIHMLPLNNLKSRTLFQIVEAFNNTIKGRLNGNLTAPRKSDSSCPCWCKSGIVEVPQGLPFVSLGPVDMTLLNRTFFWG